jgi:Domain of unknown function (DUF4136)
MRELGRRRTRSRLVGLLLLLMFVLPAAAKTVVDFDPGVNFTRFKTFAFIGGVEHLNMLQLNPDLIKDKVHQITSSELVKKGLHEVQPNENPDLVIRYWANSQQNLDVGWQTNFGVFEPFIGSYWGFTYDTVNAYSSREGSLQIDLIEPKRKDLAWRLYLIRRITNSDKQWKEANEEISKGFESFPPSAKEVQDKIKEREEHPPKSQ